jgi:hypothetical protein
MIFDTCQKQEIHLQNFSKNFLEFPFSKNKGGAIVCKSSRVSPLSPAFPKVRHMSAVSPTFQTPQPKHLSKTSPSKKHLSKIFPNQNTFQKFSPTKKKKPLSKIFSVSDVRFPSRKKGKGQNRRITLVM